MLSYIYHYKKINLLASLLMVCGIIIFISHYSAFADNIPQSKQQIQLSFAPLVKKTASAVVNIYTQKTVQQRRSWVFNDPFFKNFFDDNFFPKSRQRRIENALGSGVIVDKSGIIVTNSHVVKGSDSIKVVLNNKREYEAILILADEQSDIAILQLENVNQDLPFLQFANSDDLEVGDLVLAIGNPFGLGQTVTNGIVSALARSRINISDFQSFIQTDAAINPGNSGGALVGLDGKLIGINTAIFSRTGTSAGVGFAIPSNFVRAVIDSAMEFGEIRRLWLGIDGATLDYDAALALGLENAGGILVKNIHPLSPLKANQLHAGDAILAFDDFVIEEPSQLEYRLALTMRDTPINLTILSKGKKRNIRVTPIFPPEIPARNLWRNQGNNPLAGADYMNLSPKILQEYQLEYIEKGVIVERVLRRTPADFMGVEPGDIIDKINQRHIETVKDLRDILARDDIISWNIEVLRNNKRFVIRTR